MAVLKRVLTPLFSHWQLKQQRLLPQALPRLMGILNVTPDSFSDGGAFLDVSRAVAQGLSLVDAGADILDIGGESTRPGAASVSTDDELRRVIPVIQQLGQATHVPISIDTTKAKVAREALAAGAVILNDISGLQFDAEMPDVCAEARCGVIVNHIQGTPQTMQLAPHYEDVVLEVELFFATRMEELTARGISAEAIVLDPGIGFGKSANHNIDLMAATARFQTAGRPVLVGHSRKGFLKKVLGRPVDERLFGTVGVSVALAQLGADILRVHDVAANRDAILAWATVMGVHKLPAE